ncbi:MAG: SMP-30/gluconolactonase/LRE family protein [Candidatus Microbacterium stercoravium]
MTHETTENHILTTGLFEPEGPAYTADGELRLVEMGADAASLTRIGTAGSIQHRTPSLGRPNGLAIDGDGMLWVAEGRHTRVLKLDEHGEILLSIESTQQHPLLWPNDLAFGPDGMLYLTDSGILDTDFIDGIQIRADWATARYDGRVYRIDPVAGKIVELIDSGIGFANGIAFGPDGRLYANETIGGAVYSYDPADAWHKSLFGNVNADDGLDRWRGPDGMAFGLDGRLYCTVYGQGDVTVLDTDGSVLDRIRTNGNLPTNIAFLPDGSHRAAVTEVAGSCIEIIETATSGLPLHTPSLRPRHDERH